jgi:hypothetical protein
MAGNPGPNNTQTTMINERNNAPDGVHVGAVGSLLGFYGATPIALPHATAQAAVVDSSGGTAAATNGIVTLTATYNSTILANAIATLAAQTNAIQAALVSLGLVKGSN